MPISKDEFNMKGESPSREFVQENILRILGANPEQAFSTIELENMLDTRRQSINQALRALDSKNLIVRRFVEENKRTICYAKIKSEETNEETREGTEEKVDKPAKKKKGKAGKRGKSKKRKQS